MPAFITASRATPQTTLSPEDTASIQQAAHGQLQDALGQLFGDNIPALYADALADNPDWDANDFVRELGTHMFQVHGIHPEHLFNLIGAGP